MNCILDVFLNGTQYVYKFCKSWQIPKLRTQHNSYCTVNLLFINRVNSLGLNICILYRNEYQRLPESLV